MSVDKHLHSAGKVRGFWVIGKYGEGQPEQKVQWRHPPQQAFGGDGTEPAEGVIAVLGPLAGVGLRLPAGTPVPRWVQTEGAVEEAAPLVKLLVAVRVDCWPMRESCRSFTVPMRLEGSVTGA